MLSDFENAEEELPFSVTLLGETVRLFQQLKIDWAFAFFLVLRALLHKNLPYHLLYLYNHLQPPQQHYQSKLSIVSFAIVELNECKVTTDDMFYATGPGQDK